MRCKRHLSDLSATIGVCGSCLRERLFALIATQAQLAIEQSQPRDQLHVLDDRHRKSDPHPPPLIFPRSVSPYVTRRKSEDISMDHNLPDHQFYSTPQIGPTANSLSFSASVFRQKRTKFSMLKNLFRFGSEKLDPSPNRKPRCLDPSRDRSSTAASTSASSPLWFSSTTLSGEQKSKSRFFSDWRRRRRGMSPDGASVEDCETSSDYSSESPGWRWEMPVAPPPSTTRQFRQNQSTRGVSGLTFCLNPLVRVSPNRNWNQKDIGFSGEFRVPAKGKSHSTSSFCKNRSRKLADLGRFNHNR